MHYWINFDKIVNRCRALDVSPSPAIMPYYSTLRVPVMFFCVDTQIAICLNTKIKLFLTVYDGVEVYF